MPHDRAHRPDPTQGSEGSSGGGAPSSMPDINEGGTYFLGRYRVVDEIGIGGMASVHLARMDGPGGFQKWVAVKKIHSHLVEDDSFVQMFLDEARVAARISHPNVATVFDLGKHEDTYWIAMEYLHGEPLREVMRRTEELGTAMPPEIACRVIADAAEGLHAAHELLGKNGEKLGLVHRDVTPHNLFVTYDGTTKVVDFGIAKFSSRMAHTRAGTLKGKLAYMSPEQVHSEAIDRRTDIFALGVVLWELTTGQRLFRMESDLDTLAKVQECNVPRPSTLIRGYPVDLEKIVMKALSRNRGERFRTARELSRALQSLLMRRGLFIASDEVSAYVQSIFSDRIQKREAHLRWAAEVTQTINVEHMLAKPRIGPEFTSSEVQSSFGPRPGAIRPAAGMPPDSMPTPSASSAPSTRGGAPEPQRRAPRPAAGRPPPTQQNIHSRPAASVPPPIDFSPPPDDTDENPAETDLPTILAHDKEVAAFRASVGRPSASNKPPAPLATTLASATERDPAGGLPSAAGDFDDEDQAETIVGISAARDERSPLEAPPMFPPTMRSHARTAPQRASFAATAKLAPQAPPPVPGAPGFGSARPGAVVLDETVGIGKTRLVAPSLGNEGVDPARLGPSPLEPPRGMPPGHMQQPAPNFGFMGAGARDHRTQTAQRFKRKPPMWVVAALSCSIALLVAGVVIAIVSATSSSPSDERTTSGAPEAPSGPFANARRGFNEAILPPGADTTPTMGPTATSTETAAPPAKPGDAPSIPTATTRPGSGATGTRKVAPTPSPAGALTIVCTPKCDQIVDNGTPLGPGHVFNRPVASGRHLLLLSAPNGVKKNLQVEVVSGETREVRVAMDR